MRIASDPDARPAEQLIRDAGFEPIHLGGLEEAALLESLIVLTSTLDRGEHGPFLLPLQSGAAGSRRHEPIVQASERSTRWAKAVMPRRSGHGRSRGRTG